MRTKHSLLALSFVFVTILNGQKDYGFFGKKAFFQVESIASNPLFYNLFSAADDNTGYVFKSNQVTQKKDQINVGYRINLGYAVKRNIAVLVDAGQNFIDVYGVKNSAPSISKHETLKAVTTCIIPKIEFASAKSLLPMGLGHQIGFGIENTKIKDKDYSYVISNNGIQDSIKTYSSSASDIDPINFGEMKPIRKYVLLYALSMRTPITNHLMLQYGIRYTLHLGKIDRFFSPY